MTIATVLVSILFLARLSLLVVFLVLKGGHVTETALTVALLAVVRGFMVILDLITIIGGLKKSKLPFLRFWKDRDRRRNQATKIARNFRVSKQNQRGKPQA